uniref:Uncharacterized protein n=1 Tax=Arundo donax TaxID=35708 RepID=A0A0A9D766_ARUDO
MTATQAVLPDVGPGKFEFGPSSVAQPSPRLSESPPLGDHIMPSSIPVNLFPLSPSSVSSLHPLCPFIISSILKKALWTEVDKSPEEDASFMRTCLCRCLAQNLETAFPPCPS